MVLGLLSAAIALPVGGLEVALGTIVGAALAVTNFHVLHVLLGRLMLGDQELRSKALLGALTGLKFLVMLGIVAVLVWKLRLNAVGIFVGITSFVVALVVGSLPRSGDSPLVGAR